MYLVLALTTKKMYDLTDVLANAVQNIQRPQFMVVESDFWTLDIICIMEM